MQACHVDSNSIKPQIIQNHHNQYGNWISWKQRDKTTRTTNKQTKHNKKCLTLIGKPQRLARSRIISKNVSPSDHQPSCLQSGERQCGKEGKGIRRRGTAKSFPSATVSSDAWKKNVLEVRKEVMNLKGQKKDSYGRMRKGQRQQTPVSLSPSCTDTAEQGSVGCGSQWVGTAPGAVHHTGQRAPPCL